MKRYLALILVFFRVSVQNDAAYRADFFFQALSALFHMCSQLLGLWVIFSNTVDINGWRVNHMLVLLGVFRIMSGVVAMIVAPNMRRIMEAVRTGELDFYVLRPVNTQFLASTSRIAPFRVADILLGLALAAVGVYRLRAGMTAEAVLLFALMLATGAIIIYAFWLALATLSFWFVRVQNLEMIFWNVFEAGRYPVSIYSRPIRVFLTYVVPVAFVVTIPAQALAGMGGVERLTAGTWIIAVTAAAGMLALSSWFWHAGLRRYSGASG